MNNIAKYVMENATRSTEAGADVHYFKVQKNDSATPEDFINVVEAHKGEFNDCDPLDGQEHNYIELGAWAGDQGLALTMMGLGAELGVWKLYTPKGLLGDVVPQAQLDQMAGMGMVSVRVIV